MSGQMDLFGAAEGTATPTDATDVVAVTRAPRRPASATLEPPGADANESEGSGPTDPLFAHDPPVDALNFAGSTDPLLAPERPSDRLAPRDDADPPAIDPAPTARASEAPRRSPPTTEPDAAIDPRSLLVIDGTAMIFRAYYGLGSRRAPNGAEVGAVTGVCHQLLGVLRRQSATHVVVVFDAAQETFRNRIDPRYKANRGDPPDELVPQFDLIKEITTAIGLHTLAKLDYEADDLMATFAALARAAGIPARLVAVDKDLCQSVVDDAPTCDLYDPKSEELTDGAGVIRRLGVRPEQVVDLMALTGDSTDNIQGVRGVGPKAAVALLEAFGDLDGVYRSLDRVEYLGIRGAKALARKLEEGRDDAFLARRLVRLDDAVDLGIAAAGLTDATTWRGPRGDADPLMAEYGLRGPLAGFRRLFDTRPLPA
ncbi:MAG: 5'-3' exonuclease H3TH domain-containing protein [Nannocystaceae bacterium]